MASGEDPRPQPVPRRVRSLDTYLHTNANPPPRIQTSPLSRTVTAEARPIVRPQEGLCSEAGPAKAGKSIQASKTCLDPS